jgi:hypothetical protein
MFQNTIFETIKKQFDIEKPFQNYIFFVSRVFFFMQKK